MGTSDPPHKRLPKDVYLERRPTPYTELDGEVLRRQQSTRSAYGNRPPTPYTELGSEVFGPSGANPPHAHPLGSPPSEPTVQQPDGAPSPRSGVPRIIAVIGLVFVIAAAGIAAIYAVLGGPDGNSHAEAVPSSAAKGMPLSQNEERGSQAGNSPKAPLAAAPSAPLAAPLAAAPSECPNCAGFVCENGKCSRTLDLGSAKEWWADIRVQVSDAQAAQLASRVCAEVRRTGYKSCCVIGAPCWLRITGDDLRFNKAWGLGFWLEDANGTIVPEPHGLKMRVLFYALQGVPTLNEQNWLPTVDVRASQGWWPLEKIWIGIAPLQYTAP